MSVSPEVSRAYAEEELKEAEAWGGARGWSLDWKPEALILNVKMKSAVDGEEYLFEFSLRDYRQYPPSITPIHPMSGERGTRRAFPSGGRGYFHPNPVICAPWNRLAYQEHGGPHGDWSMAGWASNRPNHSRLGSILALLQELIDEPVNYQGRMER